MAWSHLDITKPHLVYIILGGFTSLFMLCSSVIKERMYIGEATVATLCGVIFGPHAANLINPNEWGSVDIVTLEFSRIVLVVQCFAIGVELPKFYMEKHWRSVIFLLVPVMTAGWLVVSLFIWWMIPSLDWLESLLISACVTATDPVLASSVVGKGKFARRVPKHLRDLLSAESGCNDGMAFPFLYLSLYLIQYDLSPSKVSFYFIVYTLLYECIFGAIYGFIIGYIARHSIKYAEKHDLIDRESFLVFYFVVALFCAGSGSILGLDDLLVGFSCGVGFSNDGWFSEKTKESHVSNVIDLLLNLAYFVYFGTIIPWEQFNNGVFGVHAWRLLVIAIFVLLFRRIPIMMALKPLIPGIKNWREALFAGHFGPIGVGAIFVAMLARGELSHGEPTPLPELPDETAENFKVIYLVWPIVTFLVISSILVHGSSIAVFTLGKRINTLSLTMSYTTAAEDGPSWMNRLPRITSQSRSQAKMSEASFDARKDGEFPADYLTPPMGFLRRQKDDGRIRLGSRGVAMVQRKLKGGKDDDRFGLGGPVSQSAIAPTRSAPADVSSEKDVPRLGHENTDSATLSDDEKPKDADAEKAWDKAEPEDAGKAARTVKKPEPVKVNEAGRGGPRSTAPPPRVEVYDEVDHILYENEDGDVIGMQSSKERDNEELPRPNVAPPAGSSSTPFSWSLGGLRRKMSEVYSSEKQKRKTQGDGRRRHEPARAYQFGNTVIVEDEDGEVVKTYELPAQRGEPAESRDLFDTGLKYFGFGGKGRPQPGQRSAEAAAEEGEAGAAASGTPVTKSSAWSGFGKGSSVGHSRKKGTFSEDGDDDKNIRFTIGGVGQRMTKDDFIRQLQQLDSRTRREVLDHSTASPAIRHLAREGSPSTRTTERRTVSPPASTDHGASQDGSGDAGTADGGTADGGTVDGRTTEDRTADDGSGSASPGSSLVSPGRQPPLSPVMSRSIRLARSSEQDQGETPVERRRRLAVLANQGEGGAEGGDDDGKDLRHSGHDNMEDDDGDDARYEGETPAERRRRRAALGLSADSDSEDEGTERVPPARRGIRFAEP